MRADEIAAVLADRISSLAPELLPGGHREGREWRAGNVNGEAGSSLGVHLAGHKAGIWSDFATGAAGDALDLVRASLGCDVPEAMAWARRWLGIEEGDAALPTPPLSPKPVKLAAADPERWGHTWGVARPISGTRADAYLAARGLQFDDPDGRALRFVPKRGRKSVEGEFEAHPAMLALLCDARTGEPCGIINCYLLPDGRDRLRDQKGKTSTGRVRGAVVMLDDFDVPTMGLVVCEGVETGIAIYHSGLRPLWACGGAGNLAKFPVLGGIECLTIAADADEAGQRAAEACAARWRKAGREVTIAAPPTGDWAERC
jgi:putative DNA primase/helicase